MKSDVEANGKFYAHQSTGLQVQTSVLRVQAKGFGVRLWGRETVNYEPISRSAVVPHGLHVEIPK
jgi:hypothetical protein